MYQESGKMFRQHKELAVYIVGLYYVKVEYYRAVGQYEMALKMVYQIANDSTPFVPSTWIIRLLRNWVIFLGYEG